MLTISDLKKWLKKPGNTKAKLAYLLQYETTQTIEKWILRGQIPFREQDRVSKLIIEDGVKK
jgi:hypothetical protein